MKKGETLFIDNSDKYWLEMYYKNNSYLNDIEKNYVNDLIKKIIETIANNGAIEYEL